MKPPETATLPLISLASLSPRRRELLLQIGVEHRLLQVQVDETVRPAEAPAAYVIRLATAKALAGRAVDSGQPRLPVLAADTAVVVDGEILGKPTGQADAMRMLNRLSGRTHQVLTGVALYHQQMQSRLSISTVTFGVISGAQAAAYWQSGEPADKAGGYAIQGLAAQFVTRLEGSFSGVMGLPLRETAELLQETGIKLL